MAAMMPNVMNNMQHLPGGSHEKASGGRENHQGVLPQVRGHYRPHSGRSWSEIHLLQEVPYAARAAAPMRLTGDGFVRPPSPTL